MTYRSTLDIIRLALRAPLPGPAAQELMAPRPRREWPAGSSPKNARHAAGLLLLFPLDGRAHTVLTVRGDLLERHRGQVSLPGGVIEPGETIEAAALREAHEEIGLEATGVGILGTLTPLDIPVSGFRLHPVVAAIDHRPTWTPAHGEVAQVLEVPLATLLDAATVAHRPLTRDGQTIEIAAFRTAGVEIWGATAMALAEFLTLLGWAGPLGHRHSL